MRNFSYFVTEGEVFWNREYCLAVPYIRGPYLVFQTAPKLTYSYVQIEFSLNVFGVNDANNFAKNKRVASCFMSRTVINGAGPANWAISRLLPWQPCEIHNFHIMDTLCDLPTLLHRICTFTIHALH